MKLSDDFKIKAYEDYMKLVDIVHNFQGSLQELCDELNGFNFSVDYERFDVNFGCLTATIYDVDGQKMVYEYLDIWDDEQESMVCECIHYTDIIP